MSKSHRASPVAVVDTSFWSLCAHIGLVPVLWQYFAQPILVPSPVYAEVFHTPRNYPDQVQMAEALAQGRLRMGDPQHTQSIFHPGERSVLFLAQELHAVALIDEFGAHEYAARTMGITVVSVPEFLVEARQGGCLSSAEALRYLAALEALHASPEVFLAVARHYLQNQEG